MNCQRVSFLEIVHVLQFLLQLATTTITTRYNLILNNASRHKNLYQSAYQIGNLLTPRRHISCAPKNKK